MPPETKTRVAETHKAISQALFMRIRDPGFSQRQAEAILRTYPDSLDAKCLLAASLRLQRKSADALAVLEPAVRAGVKSADLLVEFGESLAALGRHGEALAALREAVGLEPNHGSAWRALGDQLAVLGHSDDSHAAYERHAAFPVADPALVAAIQRQASGKLAEAVQTVQAFLSFYPTDVQAMRVLADIAQRAGRYEVVERTLERALQLAPGLQIARRNYALILLRQEKLDAALAEAERLLARDSDDPELLNLKGTLLWRLGRYDAALEFYVAFLARYPDRAGEYMNFGHILNALGRIDDAIAAYRRSVDLDPSLGEAYWSLANLKTFRFSDEEIATMKRAALAGEGRRQDLTHICFALGKAFEDRREFAASFEFYQRGNQLRKSLRPHHSGRLADSLARQKQTLDAEFFGSRRNSGCAAPDPIFIVGMPRSGSTLVEQILATHSQVEGTAELKAISLIAKEVTKEFGEYPDCLLALSAQRTRELGERYLEMTRHLRSGKPFFTDKMPENFRYIGLIQLILPSARIVDARRHPMACCFSLFKQLFATGVTYSYDLTDLGQRYRDYLDLMDHWDRVLPGRVHHVHYEDMVADSENQIRRLLDYCGLPFEEQCLRFHETPRAIHTPSAEQVRQPIYTQGLEQWRNYEPWLDPLKVALGPVLERYPIA